jgi:hypothetical protein
MEASPTQECQRREDAMYLSHESNHLSTAIPEQQRSLAWRHARAQHVAHVWRWSWDWRHRGASSTKSTESADADDRAAPADV